MKSNVRQNLYTALMFSLLLILTALGNARILFAVSCAGIIVYMFLFRNTLSLRVVFAATAGFLFAAMIVRLFL